MYLLISLFSRNCQSESIQNRNPKLKSDDYDTHSGGGKKDEDTLGINGMFTSFDFGSSPKINGSELQRSVFDGDIRDTIYLNYFF